MPLGARRVGKNRLIAVKTPFDMTLIKEGKCAFIDAKTFDRNVISYSMLTEHQVHMLHRIHMQGKSAGYLVWHREIDEIRFYNAKLLFDLKPLHSIDVKEGLFLGKISNFDLSLILT